MVGLRTIAALLSLFVSPSLQKCKTFPGDPDWPSLAVWSAFNTTVNGRLIRTIPIGTPCHNPTFDTNECTIVRTNWHSPAFHEQSSSSIQDPFFANKSCDPFEGPGARCIVGTYVQYAVNVSTPAHVITTVQFAKQHNIRFVVKNTGHDYMGKSTGAGGLSVWTFHLKETEWFDHYTSPGYNGPAVKAHSGASASQIYAEADERGYIVVAGACPTVGFAGGFFQGGGHGPFGSIYGLASDQTLSMEVITTTGKFVTASPTQNSDLYWALSGGGGGTYGIVYSVTLKVYPDTPVSIGLLSFSTGPTVTLDTWWEAVDFYQASTPNYTDAGAYVLALYSQGSFGISPFILPKGTSKQVTNLLQPFLTKLGALSIPYNVTVTTFPGFLSAYNSGIYPPSVLESGTFLLGGRLLPRSLWESEASLAKLTSVIRNIVDDGAVAFDLAIRPTLEMAGHPKNAVLPAWRTAERTFNPLLPWDDYADWPTVLEQKRKITSVYDEALRQITPGGGSYLNEADSSEPNWQQSFYGSNYRRLLEIKDKWDPDQVLYGATAVGGDRWVEQHDGRLCPA